MNKIKHRGKVRILSKSARCFIFASRLLFFILSFFVLTCSSFFFVLFYQTGGLFLFSLFSFFFLSDRIYACKTENKNKERDLEYMQMFKINSVHISSFLSVKKRKQKKRENSHIDKG